MDKVAGGAGTTKGQNYRKSHCSSSPNGEHDWVKTGHREDYSTFLWIEYSDGWDIYTCSLCGKTKEVHT